MTRGETRSSRRAGIGAWLRLSAGVLLLAGLGLTAHTAGVTHAQGTTIYHVNTTADDPADDCGVTVPACSIRGALADAASGLSAAGGFSCPQDVIIYIPNGHYFLSLGYLYIDTLSDQTCLTHLIGASRAYTIIDGSGNLAGNQDIYVEYPGDLQHLTVSNAFCDGCDGAGIYADDSLAINDVLITNNNAGTGGYGGGLYTESDYHYTINNSWFTNNKAYYGGGFYEAGFSTQVSINGTHFVSNVACDSSPCTGYGYGGGLYNYGGQISTQNSFFTNNTAGSVACDCGDGGGYYDSNGYMTTNYTNFTGNVAGDEGGGCYCDDYDSISSSTFYRNVAGNYGGGVSAEYYGFYANDVFQYNTAGGATSDADGYGGGMYVGEYVQISNTLFQNNSALNFNGGFARVLHKTARAPRAHPVGPAVHQYQFVNPHPSIAKKPAIKPRAVGDVCGGSAAGGISNGDSWGGGIYTDEYVAATGVRLQGNYACYGGGWADNYDYLSIGSSVFTTNSAGDEGGGLYLYGGTDYYQIGSTQVFYNHAVTDSGGIWSQQYGEYYLGGGSRVFSNFAPVCPNENWSIAVPGGCR